MCPSSSSRGRGRESQLQSQISDFRPAFDALDIDRDGKISRDDLRTFYSAHNPATSDEDIGSMMWAADSNKDGFVEFDEFNQVLMENHHSTNTNDNGVMEEVFKVMDRDGDGKVGFEDLKSYLNWAGFPATDEDIKTMIKLGGGDEKTGGGLCYQDLLKVLALDLISY